MIQSLVKTQVFLRRRCFLRRVGLLNMVIVATLVNLAMHARAVVAEPTKRPNILFIMADDHGYQALSCYGSNRNKTPNLDRLAKEGMRFDRCFVTNSICGPCRAVILTGKYSHLNGFEQNGRTFNGKQQNVAKLLRAAGYQTAMIGKWHLKSEPTGFDYYHRLIGQGPYYNPKMRTNQGEVGANGYRDINHVGYTTDIITDESLKWLKEQRDPDKPFFMMYHHKAPHRNWQPGPKYLTKYDGQTLPEPETLWDDYKGRTSAAREQAMTVARHLSPNDLKLTPPRNFTAEQKAAWDKAYGPKNAAFKEAELEGEALVKWQYQRYAKDYLRCVDSVDENVGRVLDYLDKSGLAKNTLVVYTSDQGWYLGEHGWYDKRWMYEESFRTPLLVRWPEQIKPGSVSETMVMNLDFPETFLELAGADIPDDMQGRSILPVLKGQVPEDWRKSVYYHYYEFPGAHSVQRHYGVRTDRYKLIHFYQKGEWEFFDLEKDPNELKSVYADSEYVDAVGRLKDELQRLREQYGDDGTVVDFNVNRAKGAKRQLAVKFDFAALPKGKLQSGDIVDGLKSKAVQLDGGGAAITLPRSEQLDPSYKPLEVGGWIRPSAGSGVIVAQGGPSLGYSLYLNNGKLQFAVRDNGQLKKMRGPSVELDEWTHVVATVDHNGKGQFYVNGQSQGKSRKLRLISGFPADVLSVGADTEPLVSDYESPLPFRGCLEDIRVYWGPFDEANLKEWARR